MDLSELTDVPLRGDYASAGPDFVKQQDWAAYTAEDHALWRSLYRNRLALRPHMARPLQQAIETLDMAGAIPRLEAVSERLAKATGWRLVAVPGLIPNDAFFGHLAARRFPVTDWIREPAEADYLVEPDIFHDFFGHVPLLFEPAYADYMAAYGALGRACAPAEVDALTRLYWYVVEFGLVIEDGAFKAFGAGIVSSAAETMFATTSPSPHRLGFDVDRILRTHYRIDDFQQTYFVLDGLEQLTEVDPKGLAGRLRTAALAEPIAPDALRPGDRIISRGDQSHAHRRGDEGAGDA